MRADLQQYYGINLDDMYAGKVSVRHVCALCACLQPGSRVMGKLNVELTYSVTESLLFGLLNKDLDKKNRIDPYAHIKKTNEKPKSRTVDEIAEILAKPRRAVE